MEYSFLLGSLENILGNTDSNGRPQFYTETQLREIRREAEINASGIRQRMKSAAFPISDDLAEFLASLRD